MGPVEAYGVGYPWYPVAHVFREKFAKEKCGFIACQEFEKKKQLRRFGNLGKILELNLEKISFNKAVFDFRFFFCWKLKVN